MRCVGAAVAIQPNILYGYALEAGIKELTTAVAADGRRGGARRAAARRRRCAAALVPLAVAIVAARSRAFSLGIAPVARAAAARRCCIVSLLRAHGPLARGAELGAVRRRRDRHLAARPDHRRRNWPASPGRPSAASSNSAWATSPRRSRAGRAPASGSPATTASRSCTRPRATSFDVIVIVARRRRRARRAAAPALGDRGARRDDADRALLLHRTQHRRGSSSSRSRSPRAFALTLAFVGAAALQAQPAPELAERARLDRARSSSPAASSTATR